MRTARLARLSWPAEDMPGLHTVNVVFALRAAGGPPLTPATAPAFTDSYRRTSAREECTCPAAATAGTVLVTALATASSRVTRACAYTTRSPGGPGGSGCDPGEPKMVAARVLGLARLTFSSWVCRVLAYAHSALIPAHYYPSSVLATIAPSGELIRTVNSQAEICRLAQRKLVLTGTAGHGHVRTSYTFGIDHPLNDASPLNVIYAKQLDTPKRMEHKLCAGVPFGREYGSNPAIGKGRPPRPTSLLCT